jgi:hypothetical protein
MSKKVVALIGAIEANIISIKLLGDLAVVRQNYFNVEVGKPKFK